MTRWLCLWLCLLLALARLPALAESDEFTLEETVRLTPDQVAAQMRAAVAEPDPARRPALLLAAFEAMLQTPETLIPSRELHLFLAALCSRVPPDLLRPRAAALLAAGGQDALDVAARHRLNVGLRLAAVAGGVTLGELRPLLDREGVDREWLLPALGRVGGEAALPLLQPFRQDALIIPLNNEQNIRRLPCAAVFGAAYAGAPDALDLVLQWYEEDTRNRPRFAFYVTWALSQGQRPDYALLDFCQQRLDQAGLLLDYLGPRLLPELVARANRDLSVSLAQYLQARLAVTPAAELAPYAGLLDHPLPELRLRVIDRLWALPDQRPALLARLSALLHSEYGLDRLLAAQWLARHAPEWLARLPRPDPNPAVERRLCELAPP